MKRSAKPEAKRTAAHLALPQAGCLNPPSGLVNWYNANSDANDAVGTSNGIFTNGAALATGKFGKAFSFDGVDDFVKLPDNFLSYPTSGFNTTPFTFAAWFKTSTSGVIFGQQTTSTFTNPTSGWSPLVYVGADHHLYATFDDTATHAISTTVSVDDNVFHHVAVTYDGTTKTIYLDGVNAASLTPFSKEGFASNYKYQLGTGYTANWPAGNGTWLDFNGLIDDVQIYNRSLSVSEVQSIYNATNGQCVPPPPTLSKAPAIAVNFIGGNNSSAPVGASVTGIAGFSPQNNWNNLAGKTGTSGPLLDNNGAATEATVTWSGSTIYASGQAGQNQNGRLLQGYVDSQFANSSANIANLPASIVGTGSKPYDVIVYMAADVPRNGIVSVNGSSQTVMTKGPSPDGAFVPATATTKGNYAIFPHITGTTVGISTKGSGSPVFFPLNGFQIVGANDSLAVTTTADEDDNTSDPSFGAGTSLREAINYANSLNDGQTHTITFNIPSTDPNCNAATHVCTIQVGSSGNGGLPPITSSVIIDGYSQPGAGPNTQSTNDDAVLLIELEGTDAGNAPGLQLTGGSSTIKGLVINRFTGAGIDIVGAGTSGNVITGNFIGVNANGTGSIGITGNGGEAAVFSETNGGGNRIGGSTAADRNVISGNSTHCIELLASNANIVQGNFIGLAADGSTQIGNGQTGIVLTSGSSGNIIGGVNAGEANIITLKGADGISIVTGTRNLLRGNSIYENGTAASDLGIDLGNDGVTANDSGDGDIGANNLQNFPVLTSSIVIANTRRINGTLNSNANRTYIIDFYANDACDASGHGEGKTYLGSSNVATDGSGNASFTFSPGTLNAGDVITATATDVTLFDDDSNPSTPAIPHNDTSEFSACLTTTAGTPGTLQFSATNYDTPEGNSGTHTVTVTVTRNGGGDGPASVNFATSDGTATVAGSDYDAASGTLNWNDTDSTSRSFDVTIHGDRTVEADETITLTLSNAIGATIGNTHPATITILNDDHAPVAGDIGVSQVVNAIKTITLTSSDADSDAQTFSIVANPQHGSLANFGTPNCAAGACTQTVDYTPSAGYTGPDSFTYKANDGANDSNTATVSITVVPCDPTLTVNGLSDTSDANPGDGICDDGTGQCTLRAAIEEANANNSCGALTIDATGVAGQINLTSALPAINASVNLNGPGAGTLTVERSPAGGTPSFRIFGINNGFTVTINGLTISNGQLNSNVTDPGGGILNAGILTLTNSVVSGNHTGGAQTDVGGGIVNTGTLTITNSSIINNAADGSSEDAGGGILNFSGALTIANSTISGNSVGGGHDDVGAAIYIRAGTVTIANSTIAGNQSTGGGGDQGGGIYNAGGNLTIINSTIANNAAHDGGTDQGGGIFNAAAGSLALTNCTISGNSAGGGANDQGGGIYNLGAFTARNTLISGNSAAIGPDVFGTITSQGHNLIGNTSGATVTPQPGDLFNAAATPANLGPLANNGGATQTMALLPASVAINAAGDVTTLNGAIDAVTTTLILADAGSSFPDGVGFLIQIDNELMTCVSKSGNTLIVVRGTNNTTAAAHSSGTAVDPAFDQRGAPFVRRLISLTDIGAFEHDALASPVDSDATVNSVDEGAPVGTTVGITASASDVQGATVSYSLTGDTSSGGFAINSTTGVVTVADSTKIDYESSPGHAYSITVQASAGILTSSQSFSIAVNDVAPSTPVDTDATPNSIAECAAAGTPIGITAASTDTNGPAVTFSLTGDSSGGAFTINSTTGVVTLADPAKIDFETAPGHAYAITVVASDGGTLTNSQVFTIAVFDLAPVGTNDSYSVDEGAPLSISTPGVLVNDSDCKNGAILTAILAAAPTHASSFALNANGSFSYTPANGFFGTDSFTYQPNDGTLSGNVTTVTITINPGASTPSVTNAMTLEDTQTAPGNTGELVISRNVNDGAEVTHFKITNIQNGKLFRNDGITQINSGDFIDFAAAHAGLKFKPNADFNNNLGVCRFDVQASLTNSNSGLGGGIVTATISVTPVNDAPVFVAGDEQIVSIDPGPQTVSNWASGIAPGPATATDEAGQSLNFIVTNDNNALFSAQPAVSASGTLTYTPATGASGSALVSVKLQDNGVGTPPNLDTSPVQAFAITVNCAADMVTNTNDSGPGSLRDVIANACAGDVVTFSNSTAGGATNFFDGNPHTITLTSGELLINKNLDVNGPGAAALIVSGNNASRVFNIGSGIVSLRKLAVSGGTISGSGNIGGGIFNAGTLTLISVVVSGNTYSNTADGGGGIGNNGGTLNVARSTINGNSGTGSVGGGIYSNGGTLNVVSSTISGNSGGSGGGIDCTGTIVILNSTISGNSVAAQGGGINNTAGTLAIYDSTITGNTADTSNATVVSQGGGISTGTASILKNTIVAGNVNFNNPGPNTADDINGSLNTGSSFNNLIGDAVTSGGITNGANGNIVGNGGSGTIDINTVLNPALTNNGGPTLTHLLRAGSPAIDTGANVTTLNGAIDNVTTTVVVTNATSIPACAVCFIRIESEQMTVLSKSVNTLTVFRGANSTYIAAHSDAAPVNPALDQRGILFSRIVASALDIGAVEMNYTLVASAGTPQSTAINTDFGAQLQATVSESGTPQVGVPVTFTPPATGASGSFSAASTVNTNSSGIATAPTFTANGIADGPYQVVASLAGNTVTANFALTNIQTGQTINFSPLSDHTYGDADFMVSASASSGLPVTLVAAGNCTVTTPAPGTVHLSSAGSCTITASQAGDSNYQPAATVSQSFTINKANQTITFAPLENKTFGDPDFTVGATATSGLAVSFGVSGNCTISGNTVHVTAVGSCTITASQAGNTNYNAAADVSQAFTIGNGNQEVVFNALPNRAFGDADFVVNPTASSGLQISLTAVGNCSVSTPAPGTVHLTGAGSCTITASQAGSGNYNAATSISQKFTINKANQIITFNALANRTFGDPDFTVSATATSLLPVSFGASGNCTVVGTTVHITGGGSCTITALQAGDANYNPAANVPRSFTINKANQTITFNALANKTFGDPDFTVSANATSGLALSFAATGNCTMVGSTVHLTGAGSCTITASQPGNGNYNPAASVPRSFTINTANQTITFGSLTNKTFGDPDFTVSATATSALAISFSATGNCTISASTVHLTGAGSCTITASQAGNSNYSPATSVPQTFAINKADQTIIFAALANKIFGNPDFTVSATATSGLAISFSASGNCTIAASSVHITGAGSCSITASLAASSNYNAAPNVTRSFTIGKVATATSITSSVNPSDLSQAVTFTATVKSLVGTPSGTVQFRANGLNLGSAVALNAGGVAQVTSLALTPGQKNITADYSGSGNFQPSTGTLAGGQLVNSQDSLAVDEAAVAMPEGDSGTSTMIFTITLSAVMHVPVTVSFATADGTATAPSDYIATSGTLTFNPGETTKTIGVTINGDTTIEPDETLTVNFSNPVNAVLAETKVTGTILNDDSTGGIFNLSQPNYDAAEATGFVTVTIIRTKDVSQPAGVDYATDDTGASVDCGRLNTALASARCDFTTMLGTMTFAANETHKTIDIPINRDAYAEGPEVFTFNLSNPTGGAILGQQSSSTITITDSAVPAANAIDDTDLFVKQQYHDFLNREADATGLAFWSDNIDKCKDPNRIPPGQTVAQCLEVQRIMTSAAFFLSIEFRQTGGLVQNFYVAALNRSVTNNMPDILEFTRDTQAIQRGVIVGQGDWQTQLANNRLAFMSDFVSRAEFVGLYPTTDTPAQFVDKLYLHANVSPASAQERSDAIAEFGGAATAADPAARGRALLRITQNASFQARELIRSFVEMEYLAYLRRNPNDPPDGDFSGYNFWLNKLTQTNGDFLRAEMVKAFLRSNEYRRRFGLE